MNSDLLIYVSVFLIIFIGYIFKYGRTSRSNQAALNEATDAGLTEPASLHPVIDEGLCIGCGSCIDACHEKKVLGLIRRKSTLINPTDCIGHGACAKACPTKAISLVFGTAKRGVDIPQVAPNFETNVPGLFIAGELGGMGLIRNAIEQGKQAMDGIRRVNGIGQQNNGYYDVIIIGAGPAGIAASLSAKANKLKYLTIEQDSLGGTVAHFPRGKIVMTAPAELPLAGKVHFRETTKETLLAFWQKIYNKIGLTIHFNERMENISRKDNYFDVSTNKGDYKTKTVLLAIGRRGTPRKLGVPGEELNKVVYRLIDPEQYRGQHVLVVGGGDSALEAACSIAEQPGSNVTLSYRSEAFGRAKAKNRARVDQFAAQGTLKVLMSSNIKLIEPDKVTLEQNEKEITVPNQAVIICAGGILPTPFLKRVGIHVETKYGTA